MSIGLVNAYFFGAGEDGGIVTPPAPPPVGGGIPARTIAVLASAIPAGSITADTPYTLSWPTPARDELGMYSAGQPTRFTAPRAMRVVVNSNLSATGTAVSTESLSLEIRKNGSLVLAGRTMEHSTGGGTVISNTIGRTVQSPVISLGIGDYVEVLVSRSGTSISVRADSATSTAVGIYEVVDPGCTLVKIDTSTALSDTVSNIEWQSEVFDDFNAWVDSNPELFSVSTQYDKVLMTGAAFSNAANFGDDSTPRGWADTTTTGGFLPRNYSYMVSGSRNSDLTGFNIVSGSFKTAPSGFGKISKIVSTVAHSLVAPSSFSLEVHSRDCCYVSRGTAITAIDADTTPYYPVWDSIRFNDAAMFNPTRFDASTIRSPGGWIQLGAVIALDAVDPTASIKVSIEKYSALGSLVTSYCNSTRAGVSNPIIPVISPHLYTLPGEYFKVKLEVFGDTSVTLVAVNSSFWAEMHKGNETVSSGERTFLKITRNYNNVNPNNFVALSSSASYADYDGNDAFTAGSSRLYIRKAGYYNLYAMLRKPANSTNNAPFRLRVTKNGAAFWEGLVEEDADSKSAAGSRMIQTPVVYLAVDDYLEVEFSFKQVLAGGTYFYTINAEILLQRMRSELGAEYFTGALVYLDASETRDTTDIVNWNAERYDTSNTWSTSNRKRLIVPSGFTRAQITGNFRSKADNTPSTGNVGTAPIYLGAVVRKNGSTTQANFNVNSSVPLQNRNFFTDGLICSANEYYEILWGANSARIIGEQVGSANSGSTLLGIQFHNDKIASAKLANTRTINPSAGAGYTMTWEVETADDMNAFTLADPSKFTVQEAGIYQCSFNAALNLVTANSYYKLFINHHNSSGAVLNTWEANFQAYSSNPSWSVWTRQVHAKKTDYFTAGFVVDGDSSVRIDTDTRMHIRKFKG